MLFEVKKYKPEGQPPAPGPALVDEINGIVIPFDSLKLNEVIKLVDHGRSVHWVSDGDWSMHQLLQKLLEKTGPADVWISSYAFSEKPARVICDLKANRIIRELQCIIDSRVDVRSASALTMVRNASDKIKLCDTHAKVTVIKNDEWFLAVVGSANYTTNKRYEAGFISANAGIALFHQNWIENELGKSF